MGNKIIWIDDIRKPRDFIGHLIKDDIYVVWCQNYWDFERLMMTEDPLDNVKFISFDHDLASFTPEGTEFTGYDCAKLLIDYCIDHNKVLPCYSVHSDNGPGADNIKKLLDNFKKFQENEKYINNCN